MRSDSEVNYAANPYGLPPERRVRRSLSKPLVLTVAGVTLLAGAGLAAFTFLRAGGGGGPPPMIEADATPTKSRAPDRGGAEDAAAPDRLVYERLSGATRPSVERLLPPPEQPMPRPIVAADPPPPPPEPPKPAQTAAVPPVNMLATPTPPPPGKPGQQQSAAAQANNKPGQPNQAAPHQPNQPPGKPGQQPAAAPPPNQNGKPGQQPAPSPQQHAALPPGAPPSTLKPPGQNSPPPAPVSSGGAGGWRIQLASVRSEAEASAEWKRLQARFPGVLGGLSLQVSKADLGDKGVFYRVHGGGVDEVRARSACDQLKSQNVGCVVVKP